MTCDARLGRTVDPVPDDGGSLMTLTRDELLDDETEPPAETSAQPNRCVGCGDELAPANGHRERK
jgi:hypothetical protein